MQETLFIKLLKYALYVVFAVGVVIGSTMPWMLDLYVSVIHRTGVLPPNFRAFILPFMMIVAIPCLWVVMEMILMMRSIPSGPFVKRNVHALYRVGILFFLLVAMFIVKSVFFPAFMTLFCMLLFIGGGLFSFTFAELINQSITFREENDLTI